MSGGDNTAHDDPATEAAHQAPTGETHEAKGENDCIAPSHPEPLSVVSESKYRCFDENASVVRGSCPVGIQSIPSKIEGAPTSDAPTLPGSARPIKIIVISDYICSFCYICDKVLRDAIESCLDLPVQFDVEFRPFTLLKPAPPMMRNAYVAKKLGKEQADIALKAVAELAQKAGLKIADDSVVCRTTQAHRLSTKAYLVGGQSLQNKFNRYIFDASFVNGGNVGDEDLLVEAAVHAGFMNKEEATAFLHSTEYLDCVEKMVEAARAQGISGVPFVIIDGKWAVNGLQPMECFIQIFRKLAHLPVPITVPGKPKAKHESKVH